MLETVVKQSESLPANSKLLILGAGFSGQHLAAAARALGVTVVCSRRKASCPNAEVVFDSELNKIPSSKSLRGITHLISCIPPDRNGNDPVLTSLSDQLKNMPLQWAGYLSTTGVYGDRQGNWASEQDLPNPKQKRSIRRLCCEKAWLASGLPVQILRLPGIYGPGRSAFESIISEKNKMIHKPGQVFSRIHIDDIAAATLHLINLAAQGNMPKIINIADNLPTNNIEVMSYAASLKKTCIPPIVPFEIAKKNLSPMALSFWQENRKVSNKMLCNKLGYKLIHPDYKSGLHDCLIQGASNAKQ